MSRVRHTVLVSALLALAACHVGPQGEQTDIGRQPYGAMIDVEIGARGEKTRRQGELLEVRDDGLVILMDTEADAAERMALIPWARIKRASASELPGIAVRTSQGDSQRKASIEKLRNVSRFPQGLTPDLANQLLAHYGQTTLDTIE